MESNDNVSAVINANFIILKTQFKALQSVLTPDQFQAYRDYIDKEMPNLMTTLAQYLTPEHIDIALRGFDS